MAHVCGLIHQVYADFSEPLKKGLLKVFDSYGGKDEERVSKALKLQSVAVFSLLSVNS